MYSRKKDIIYLDKDYKFHTLLHENLHRKINLHVGILNELVCHFISNIFNPFILITCLLNAFLCRFCFNTSILLVFFISYIIITLLILFSYY